MKPVLAIGVTLGTNFVVNQAMPATALGGGFARLAAIWACGLTAGYLTWKFA